MSIETLDAAALECHQICLACERSGRDKWITDGRFGFWNALRSDDKARLDGCKQASPLFVHTLTQSTYLNDTLPQ